MKKAKLFIVSLISVFALCLSVNSVFALPSQDANGGVLNFIVDGQEREDIYIQFENVFEGLASDKLDLINRMNDGETISVVLSGETFNNTASIDLSEYKLLTSFRNLIGRYVSDDDVVDGLKNVKATWEVPNLVEGLGEIYVLHYSPTRGVWEFLTPTEINYDAKTITCVFPDLSPVAVVYKTTSTPSNPTPTPDGGNNGGPGTGDSSNVPLYGLGIMVSLGAIGLLAKRTKKSEI